MIDKQGYITVVHIAAHYKNLAYTVLRSSIRIEESNILYLEAQ